MLFAMSRRHPRTLGLITPPVGMALFVLRSMNEQARMTDIVYGAMPFVGIILAFLAFLAFLYAVPDVVMWLPNQAR